MVCRIFRCRISFYDQYQKQYFIEVHFLFQITLHIEDAAVLYKIRDRLGIGIVSVKWNTCSLRVNSFQVIINSLLPIFDKYPLLTHKQLNYRDWRKAILLKKLLKENSRSLSTSIFNEILELKNSMNQNRNNLNFICIKN